MILFADDTNLFLHGPNLDDICIQLNLEIKKKIQDVLATQRNKKRQISL